MSPEEATILPPVYQQEAPKTAPPKYSTDKPVPLPTYDQSEKYEKDGVLHVTTSSPDEDSTDDSPPRRMWHTQNGSCFEFILFFTGKDVSIESDAQ